MSSLKCRILLAALVFTCFLCVMPAAAQNRSIIIQRNSGDVFLGITMEDVTASNMSEYSLKDEKGVIVRSVQGGSPAEKSGLRENDVILEFAGQSVWSSGQFSRLVSETPAGRNVAITVSRDGKRMNLSAALTARTGRDSAGNAWGPGTGAFDMDRFLDGSPRAERLQQRPRFGVETQPLTEQMAEFLAVPGKKGALITSVSSGSASEGKLKAGDVVIGVDDREVTGPVDLMRFAGEASGETDVKIIRDKKQISVTVTLSSEGSSGRGFRL